MAAIDYFNEVWDRCDHLSAIHAYIESNASQALRVEELLRAEWVARVSAFDLYIHELVIQRMLEIFQGLRVSPPAYLKFKVSLETTQRIQRSSSLSDQIAAFELDIRQQLDFVTYQDPEKVAEGIRLISSIELWNEVVLFLGASQATKVDEAKAIKRKLSLIARRRNKIAHEGDMQPTNPRTPWPIDRQAVSDMRGSLHDIAKAIHALV